MRPSPDHYLFRTSFTDHELRLDLVHAIHSCPCTKRRMHNLILHPYMQLKPSQHPRSIPSNRQYPTAGTTLNGGGTILDNTIYVSLIGTKMYPV